MNESTPRPHHHCFIPERSLSNLCSYNSNGSTQGLRCDQYMLANFPGAIERAISYEGQHFHNQETNVMFQIRNHLENIRSALANLTGLSVNETTPIESQDIEPCRRRGVPSLVYYRREVENRQEVRGLQVRGEEEPQVNGQYGSEEGTGGQRRTSSRTNYERSGEEEETGQQRRVGTTTLTPTTSTTATPTTPTPTTATPTTATPIPSMCTTISSPSDQYIYIFELWYAMYYTQLDLSQMKNCL